MSPEVQEAVRELLNVLRQIAAGEQEFNKKQLEIDDTEKELQRLREQRDNMGKGMDVLFDRSRNAKSNLTKVVGEEEKRVRGNQGS